VVQLGDLRAIFQNVFILATRFARQEKADRLVAAISLASDWEKFPRLIFYNFPVRFDDEQDIRPSEEQEGAIWSEAFFQMIEYMRAVPHLHNGERCRVAAENHIL
jgi:hypothetical protein